MGVNQEYVFFFMIGVLVGSWLIAGYALVYMWRLPVGFFFGCAHNNPKESTMKTADQVKAIFTKIETLTDGRAIAAAAEALEVSEKTVYRWRGEGCDERTYMALECLGRRLIEKRALEAQKRLDELKWETPRVQ